MLASSSLRSSRALPSRPAALLEPSHFVPTTHYSPSPSSFFSTSTTTGRKTAAAVSPSTPEQARPSILTSVPIHLTIRHASTSPTGPAPASTTTNPPSSLQETPLTWNRFLALRRTRRKISVVASSFSAIGTTFIGLKAFIEGNYDSVLASNLGLDPFVTSGITAFALLATGWLIGPAFGNAVFNVVYRKLRGEIEEKERQFYARIKAHRVDPTSSSMANPVPDYYGEKIGSVAGYRRWLKDQRAFNLKRGAYTGSK